VSAPTGRAADGAVPRGAATDAKGPGPLAAAAPQALVAIDIGNSKTDLVLVARDGSVLAARRGATASHQRIGFRGAARRLLEMEAAVGLAPGSVALAVVCAAGADTPSQVRRIRTGLERAGVGARVVVRNDADAILRAGSPAGWGIALVCGSGVNCLGIAPGGRSYRLPALGAISGDWGGGHAVGLAGLGAAIRGRDGRGPRTELERTLPPLLGARRPLDVALAI
jgi:N-acetylglucosamine kinase-like BadF-type ATPase